MTTEACWRERIAAARRRGDHLAAFDAACEGLVACPESLPLHYAAILALARSGATRGAQARLDALRASGALDDIRDPSLACDVASLDGRLAKDAWARSRGAAARGHARRSAEAYADAFARFGTYYPAINAATMFLAAGDMEAARRLARRALDDAAAQAETYWACASAAEACLILADSAAAQGWLARAAALAQNLDDVASTRRQILFVARETGADRAVVDRLPAPPVRYWLDDAAGTVAQPDLAAFMRDAPGIAFGTVATAADLERARQIADWGAEINLVLPCEPPAWLEARSAAEADDLRPMLERLLERAASVLVVTREGRPHDPAALDLCRRQARGLARLRARHLFVAPERLLWGADAAAAMVVRGIDAAEAAPSAMLIAPYGADPAGREPRVIVFGDVRGFSRLGEADQLRFLECIVGGFADVLAAERALDYAETAGDGLYLVFSDVERAAHCCFGLRDVLDPARVAAAGLPTHLGLRLSAHVGPLYRRLDRVTGRLKFCGSEVIRTARIEPVTPVGEIYVTEQFAATLADVAGDRYDCDYAGRQPMAKGFGFCRMYALRRSRE